MRTQKCIPSLPNQRDTDTGGRDQQKEHVGKRQHFYQSISKMLHGTSGGDGALYTEEAAL